MPQLAGGAPGRLERREVPSTAAAAERASKEPGAAAIAGSLAAEIYNVPIVVENIEDSPDNITRFFVVAERMAERTGHDKTSLVLSIKDELVLSLPVRSAIRSAITKKRVMLFGESSICSATIGTP